MTFAYCTNIWSHHQGCVCRELAKLLGEDFKMVMFQPLDCEWSKERIAMGWDLLPPDEPWCVGPPKDMQELAGGCFSKYLLEADVAVIGISPYMDMAIIKKRIKSGRLTFIMGERYFKRARRWHDFLNPKQWRRWIALHLLLAPRNVHFLTMNHWCADDLSFLRVCKGRTWRWGYLTACRTDPPPVRRNCFVKIGWGGRMFEWKQVDLILMAFAELPCRIKNLCRVEILGDGEMRSSLETICNEKHLGKWVKFGSMMPQKEYAKWLSNLDVYILASNRNEGWGATLVEAMDAGCAVIANADAGVTLEVVKDGENGYVFSGNDVGLVIKRLKTLVEDASLRNRFGRSAWQTIQEWTPKVGAERILSLASDLLADGCAFSPHRGLCQNIR